MKTFGRFDRNVLLVGSALAIACIAGMIKDDAELEQMTYCVNVERGIWPDYEQTYKVECGGKDPPKFNVDFAKQLLTTAPKPVVSKPCNPADNRKRKGHGR